MDPGLQVALLTVNGAFQMEIPSIGRDANLNCAHAIGSA